MLRSARLCCIALVVLAVMGGAYAQDIYKWVDSHGVTQYTTTPPPPGVAATLIRAAPAPSAEAASQAKAEARRIIDEANRRAAEREREQAQQQAQGEAERRSAAERLQLCARAREQLDVVTRGGPVFRHDERGEHVYLEDSARDAEIARLRGEVAKHCLAGEAAPSVQDAATRQRAAQAARLAQCDAARDALRDLESLGPRVPTADIERARERARRLCTTTQ